MPLFFGSHGTELLSRSKEDKSSMEGKSAMIQLILERLAPSNKCRGKCLHFLFSFAWILFKMKLAFVCFCRVWLGALLEATAIILHLHYDAFFVSGTSFKPFNSSLNLSKHCHNGCS